MMNTYVGWVFDPKRIVLNILQDSGVRVHAGGHHHTRPHDPAAFFLPKLGLRHMVWPNEGTRPRRRDVTNGWAVMYESQRLTIACRTGGIRRRRQA